MSKPYLEEFQSGHTEEKPRYIHYWTNYIQELTKLGLPLIKAGDGLFDELTAIQDRLDELVKIAADEDFPNV